MPPTVKCRSCGKTIPKTAAYADPTKPRTYYCDENCYSGRESMKSDWVKLTDYINELYGADCNWQLVIKQIENMKKEYKYTDAGIRLALRYFVEVEGKGWDTSTGVGIVPYYYDKAKQYWMQCRAIEKLVDEINEEDDQPFIVTKPFAKPLKHKPHTF